MNQPTDPTDLPPTEPNHTDHVRERLRFADATEALLRSILEALGYNASVTPADLLTGVTAWLSVMCRWTADPTGLVASFWASAFQSAFRASNMLTADGRRGEATEAADAATLAYQRRFPPLLEDGDAVSRDTVDDLEALREALDRQTEATAWATSKLEQADAEVIRLHEELESALDALSHVAVVVGALSLSDVPDAVAKLRALADAAEAKRDEREATITTLETELARAKVELAELKRAAIVPRPRPERVVAGQRWALYVVAGQQDTFANKQEWRIGAGLTQYSFVLPQSIDAAGDSMQYLGAAPKTEA